MRNIMIVVISLFLALGLNIFFVKTDVGQYIKSSVIESAGTQTEKSDLFLEKVEDTGNIVLNLKASKNIVGTKSLSFSLVYNDENVNLLSKKSYLEGVEILNLFENEGYSTLVLNFKNGVTINSGDDLLSLTLEKVDFSKKENMNLMNSNVTDEEGNVFSLTTSGVEF